MAGRRIAVMQPYFFPYIGYFQLMEAVDVFVIYDNLKYTKKGWINRNRFLLEGSESLFSVPLEKASDTLHIDERRVAESFDREKLLRRVRAAYRTAGSFEVGYSLFEKAVNCPDRNLFRFLDHSIRLLANALCIDTEIIPSSTVNIDHSKRGQEKVLAICESLGATHYINAIGGVELYQEHAFDELGIELRFVCSELVPYHQFGGPFVPWLSILDALMFNSLDATRELVRQTYTLQTQDHARVPDAAQAAATVTQTT